MAIKQIDVLSSGMSKLLDQWKDSPNFRAFLRSVLLQLKEVETTFYQLLNERGIYTAIGAQLDILGKLVGEERGGRSDDLYRQAILGRISVNKASGTIDDVKNTAKSLSGAPYALLFEHYPLCSYIFVPAYVTPQAERTIDASHIASARTRVLWTDEPENIIYSELDESLYTDLLHTGEGEQIIVNDNGGIYELSVSMHSFITSQNYFTSLVPGATSYQVVDGKGKMASLVPVQEIDLDTGYIIDQDGNYIVDNFGNYIRYIIFGEEGGDSDEDLDELTYSSLFDTNMNWDWPEAQ